MKNRNDIKLLFDNLDSLRTHNENATQGLVPLDFLTFLHPHYVLTHNDKTVSSLSVAAVVVFVGFLVMSYPGVWVIKDRSHEPATPASHKHLYHRYKPAIANDNMIIQHNPKQIPRFHDPLSHITILLAYIQCPARMIMRNNN